MEILMFSKPSIRGNSYLSVAALGAFCLSSWVTSSAQQTAAREAASDDAAAGRATDSSQTARRVPRLVRYSGAIRAASGEARTGTAGLTFAIYGEAQGGAPLWLETQNVKLDEQGRYAVMLGSSRNEGLPTGIFATGEARWLGVREAEEGSAEQPRIMLVSVPYALTAGDSQSLGGRPASDFQLTRTAMGGDTALEGGQAPGVEPAATAGTAGRIGKFTNATDLGDSVMFDDGTNVGVGTVTPGAKLDVAGKIRISTNAGGSFLELTGTSGSRPYIGVNTDNQFDIRGALAGTRFINNAGSAINIIMTDDGKIGVGTGAPTEKLEVAGNANFFGNVTLFGGNAGLFLNSTSGNRPYVVGNTDNQLDLRGGTAGTRFINNAGSAINIIMTDAGKVGVGLGSPTEKLEVAGNQKLFGDLFLTGNGAAVQFTSPSGNKPYISGTGVSQLDIRGALSGTRFLNNAASLVNIMVTDAGNVGIGPSNPSQKLEVAGTIYSTSGGFKFPDGSTQTTAASTPSSISASNSTQVLLVTQNGAGAGSFSVGTPPPAALRGDATAATGVTTGVIGITSATLGRGVIGESLSTSGANAGVYGVSVNSDTGSGVWGVSTAATGDANGVFGTASSTSGTGVFGEATATSGDAVGVAGVSYASGGTGVLGQSNATAGENYGVSGRVIGNNTSTSAAGMFIHTGSAGSLLVGRTNTNVGGTNVFRVDLTGKGFFNGGTQTGGADFAESVTVKEAKDEYQPGDVIAIDTTGTRRFTKVAAPYSTLVAGIYSTKPGVLATPHGMDDPRIASEEIPLAVVGIVPCKVTSENGTIKAGDLLVASSREGYAMKGTDRKRMNGAVIGKALQDMKDSTGVIEVLVSLQ
jgi:hypothetical protein